MEETKDIIGEKLTANENTTENIDQEIKEVIENDPDVMKLKAQEAELMSLMSHTRFMKAYRAIRSDIYGVSERRQMSKKEKKKKKAKRRMVKKSKK